MSDLAEKMARVRKLRNAALLAMLIPATFLAGCAAQSAPPPAPQPMAAPAYNPPPPPPAPPPSVPPVRG